MIQISSPRNDEISLKIISENSKKKKLNYPFQPNDNNSGFEINSLSFEQSESESQRQPKTTLQQFKVQKSQFNTKPINDTQKHCYNSDIVQQSEKDIVQEHVQKLNNLSLYDNNNITSHIVQKLLNKNLSDSQFAKQQDKKKKIQLNENSLYKLTQLLILLLIGLMSPIQMVLENVTFVTYGNLLYSLQKIQWKQILFKLSCKLHSLYLQYCYIYFQKVNQKHLANTKQKIF